MNNTAINVLCAEKLMRVEELIHVGGMLDEVGAAKPLRDFLADADECDLARLLDIPLDAGLLEDPVRLADRLSENGKLGFLVRVAIPIPMGPLDESGYYTHGGWGRSVSEWFYADDFCGAFGDELAAWREGAVRRLAPAA